VKYLSGLLMRLTLAGFCFVQGNFERKITVKGRPHQSFRRYHSINLSRHKNYNFEFYPARL
jgi:hypothetical protein